MGITHLSIQRLEKFDCLKPLKMCELGAQNIYIEGEWYGKIAKEYFTQFGVEHDSYDINVHQGCEFIDLREPLTKKLFGLYDVVTDYGTTEHVKGNYYMANRNIHDLIKVGGIMIRENPKTGHWPNHCLTYDCNYIDKHFYLDLAEHNGYEILELDEEYAMGNHIDGGNVVVVLRKVLDKPFMSEEQFNEKITFYSK